MYGSAFKNQSGPNSEGYYRSASEFKKKMIHSEVKTTIVFSMVVILEKYIPLSYLIISTKLYSEIIFRELKAPIFFHKK